MARVREEKRKFCPYRKSKNPVTEYSSSSDTLLLHMWKVPDSYLGRENSYPDGRYYTLN
jgi:hypothetical protein